MSEPLKAKMTISLTVENVEASLRWYEGLGLSVDQRWEDNGTLQGVMMKAGDALLGISQDDFSKGRNRTKGVGSRIHLETAQNIEELASHATAAGLTIVGPAPLPWGPMGFSATDPDGFNVSIANPEK